LKHPKVERISHQRKRWKGLKRGCRKGGGGAGKGGVVPSQLFAKGKIGTTPLYQKKESTGKKGGGRTIKPQKKKKGRGFPGRYVQGGKT